jgi:membrane protein YdbS with pleckstrin-like domain
MKNDIIKIIVKYIIAMVLAIASYFGISTLISCSTSHNVQSSGRAYIITVDTTFVKHGGFVRSKNFVPYGD